jgi:hypothetical protein
MERIHQMNPTDTAQKCRAPRRAAISPDGPPASTSRSHRVGPRRGTTTRSDLWIRAADGSGGPPRKLTHGWRERRTSAILPDWPVAGLRAARCAATNGKVGKPRGVRAADRGGASRARAHPTRSSGRAHSVWSPTRHRLA